MHRLLTEVGRGSFACNTAPLSWRSPRPFCSSHSPALTQWLTPSPKATRAISRKSPASTWAAHRRRLRTGKPELHQIEFVDKCVDHAHRVARIHVVVEALRRRNRAQIERALADADAGIARLVKALAKDIMTEDEVAHEMCPLRADQDRLKGELALAAEDTAPAP